jgi:NAD(P)-dependent dehydrogenase (short-subunit alcohol dehydrogenase family)
MNKVVLITGGSKGIGRATALRFYELGYSVAICSKTKDELDEVANKVNGLSIFCDVRCPDHVERLFDAVLNKYHRLDVLVNCAGILGPHGHLEDNSIQAWKDTIDVNLIGTVNCVQKAIPIMKDQSFGRIVAFCGGGVGGNKIEPGFSAYATSKFAVGGFVEAISKELCFYDIAINAVSPGAIDTDMARQRWVKGTSPDKVVDLITFLASANKRINGKILSAVWDNYKDEDYSKENLFNLRRIV